jgi:hypothetical protein
MTHKEMETRIDFLTDKLFEANEKIKIITRALDYLNRQNQQNAYMNGGISMHSISGFIKQLNERR